tara:strand:- start:497 stop:814 length:318 start_codon:yes stop_codon:yes gene_type:complete
MIKTILFLYSLTLGSFKKNIINNEIYDLVERIASHIETIDDNEWKPLLTTPLEWRTKLVNGNYHAIRFQTDDSTSFCILVFESLKKEIELVKYDPCINLTSFIDD